jgi:O-antigen ligase
MGGEYIRGSESRSARRRTTFPLHLQFVDIAIILLLLLVPAGVIWILGGNRDWIMMPAVALIIALGIIFAGRTFVSAYRSDLVIPPGGLVGLVFLAYLGIMAPRAEIPHEAWTGFYKFSSYILAFWIWFNLLRYNGRWKWALAVVMLSVSVMAWYALIQEAQGTRFVFLVERPAQYETRASGAFVCPNHFAYILMLIMVAGTGVLFASRAGLPLKLFAGYAALVCLYPFVLTLSRAGLIGLMTGMLVTALFLALRAGIKKFIIALIVVPLLIAGAGYAVYSLSPEFRVRIDAAVQGDIRIPLWKDSIEIVRDNPWIGHGLGSYRYMFPRYQNHLSINTDPEFAHNDYIHFGGEIGIIGLLLAGAIFLSVTWRALRVIRRDENGSDAALMAGLLGMLAGTAAHTMFDFNLNIFGCVHVLVFLFAVLLAATNNKDVDTTYQLRSRPVPRIGFAIIIVLAAGLWIHSVRTLSYFDEARAETMAWNENWDEAVKYFDRAIAREPGNWRAHMGRGNTYRVQAFWMRNPEKRAPMIREAEASYEVVTRLNPWSPIPWYGFGMLARMKNDEDAALGYFRAAVDRVPRYTAYLDELGNQLFRMRLNEEALAVYTKSIQIAYSPAVENKLNILKRRLAAQPGSPSPGN